MAPYVFAFNCFFLKLFDPKGDYTLSSQQIDKIKNTAMHCKTSSTEQDAYIKILAFIKILAPEQEIKISNEELGNLCETMRKLIDLKKFEVATYLKILAAHKVAITSPGVMEFEMYPAELEDSTTSIPEEREF